MGSAGHGGAMERVRPWDQGTRERNLAVRLLKNRTWNGLAALYPGNWRTGSDGAGGVFRINPADALMGWQAATVQVAGDTGIKAATFQICLWKLCHKRRNFLTSGRFMWSNSGDVASVALSAKSVVRF